MSVAVEAANRLAPPRPHAASTEIAAPPTSRSLSHRISRGALVSFIANGSALGLAFLGQVLLARLLGVEGFGEYIVAYTWIILLATPARLGFDGAAATIVPRCLIDNDHRTLAGFLTRSRQVPIAVGLLIAVAVVIVAAFMPNLSGEFRTTLALGAFAIPFQATLWVQQGILRGLKQMAWSRIPLAIQAVLSTLFVTGWWCAHDFSIAPHEAIVAFLIATVLASLVAVLAIRTHACGTSSLRVSHRFQTKVWLRLGASLALVALVQILYRRLSVVWLGATAGAEEAGIFSAAMRVVAMLTLPLDAIAAITGPIAAELHQQGRISTLQRSLSRTSVLLSLGLAAALLALVGAGGWLLTWFGPTFAQAQAALYLMALGTIVNAAVGPVGTLLTLTGHHATTARVMIAATMVNVVLHACFVPAWGMLGAAGATAITTTCWSVALYLIVRRRLGIDCGMLAIFARTPH